MLFFHYRLNDNVSRLVEKMDGEDDWCVVNVKVEKNEKLSIRDLLFPENLSYDTLKIHLINRSIIKKDNKEDKDSLVQLFRKYVSPRPRRVDDRVSQLNRDIQRVTLFGAQRNSAINR